MNRYFTTVQDLPQFDTFDLPYNELATALLSKQKQYDDEAAKLAEVEAGLGKLQDARWTQGISKEIQDSYLPRIQELTAGNIDLSTPEGKQRRMQLQAEIAKDERIKLAALGMAKQTQWEQIRAKDPNANMAALSDIDAQGNPIQWRNSKGWDSKTANQFDVFNSVIPFADMDKEILQLTSNVRADLLKELHKEGTTIEYDEATDRYFRRMEGSSKIIEEIGPGHPQFDAANRAAFQQFELGNTPATNYFKTKYKHQISANPDFGVSYIQNLVDRVRYKKTDEKDESSITPIAGGGSGKKKGNSSEGGSINPITESVIGNTLNLSKGTNPYDNYIASKTVLDNFTNDLKKSGYTLITNNETGYTEIAKSPNLSVAEQNKIDEINLEFKNKQLEKSLHEDIHIPLAEKYGLNPEDIYQNVSQKIMDAANRVYENTKKTYFALVPSPSFSKIEKAAQEAKFDYLKKQSQTNIGKYLQEYDKIVEANGLLLQNVNAYPLNKDIFSNDIAGAFRVLQDSSNYGTETQGGFIEYLRTNKAITSEDKKYISNYLKDKDESWLKGRLFIMHDPEHGGYAATVAIPRESGNTDPILIKIPDKLLPALSTTAKDELDGYLNNSDIQTFRENYYNKTKDSKGSRGEIKGKESIIPVTHLVIEETINKPNVDWGTPVGPPTILKQGSGIFTLPKSWGLGDIVFKTGSINKLYDFINILEAQNAIKGGVITKDNSGIKLTATEINELAKENGIESIVAPGLYKKYYKDIRTFTSPK